MNLGSLVPESALTAPKHTLPQLCITQCTYFLLSLGGVILQLWSPDWFSGPLGIRENIGRKQKSRAKSHLGVVKKMVLISQGPPPKETGGPRDLGSFGSLGHSLGGTL